MKLISSAHGEATLGMTHLSLCVNWCIITDLTGILKSAVPGLLVG